MKIKMKAMAGSVFCPLLLLLVSVGVFAGPVYDVDSTIGAGSVSGTIETDGTIGVINQAQILDWNLTISDGTNSINLLGPLSGSNSEVFVFGVGLSATAAELLFDFSDDFAVVLFQNPNIGSGINFWCIDGTEDGGCSGRPNAESVLTSGAGSTEQWANRFGVVSLADGSSPSAVAVPVLSGWAMLWLMFMVTVAGVTNIARQRSTG